MWDCMSPEQGFRGTYAPKSLFGELAPEVLSSDFCRGLIADDENDLAATPDAFDVLHYIAGKRLARRRLTVVDATSVRAEDRRSLVQVARSQHALAVAIVLNIPARLCLERNAARADRQVPDHAIRRHVTCCASRWAASSARASTTSGGCRALKRPPPSPSSACRCGAIAAPPARCVEHSRRLRR